jgi:uncharacterized SAM-binding protein YcdF (DUF218 family)
VKRKRFWVFAFIPLLLILGQLAYFSAVYLEKPLIPDKADLILVYSGDGDRAALVRQWAVPKGPLFLFSGWDYSQTALDKELGLGPDRIWLENQARTTDQNARYSAPIIRRLGVHSVLLALPWFQLPRALFLTRFYLSGTGIQVTPVATIPVGHDWRREFLFAMEIPKFWGSLFRIGLSWVGVEHWPPHVPY